MAYVDGFLLAVPTKKVDAYLALARKAGKVWREHGALEYREAAGDDLKIKTGTPFPKAARAKSSETVFFSWIVYRSRQQRDQVNKKIMKDPQLLAMMKGTPMPFDVKKMAYGGFKTIVDL